VGVFVLFIAVPGVLVLVRPVLAFVGVAVGVLPSRLMRMLVGVFVDMPVLVGMRMRVVVCLPLVGMLVLMPVLMGVLVLVLVRMLPFHETPPSTMDVFDAVEPPDRLPGPVLG
jgi:hypothetical protein